ncbi:MAG TPA: tetratricopeptide repeat protein [Gemmatimonadales bacterium]|nr:tetratricopeptide repeat protein [Gemmatimonadales bacterium]
MRKHGFITSCLMVSVVAAGCGGPRRPSSDANAAEAPGTPTTVSPPAGTPPSNVVAPVSFKEAETAYTEKRYSDALRLFTAYTSERPENVWGYYMLGLSAWKGGDRETAVKAFSLALEKDSTHVKSHLNLGRVLIETDRAAEAIPHIEAALKIDSTSGEGFRVLARAKRTAGDLEGAITAYKRAIVLDGRDTWSLNGLGRAYIESGKFDEALGPLARAVEIDSSSAVVQRNLGIALEHSSRVDLAALAKSFEVEVQTWK